MTSFQDESDVYAGGAVTPWRREGWLKVQITAGPAPRRDRNGHRAQGRNRNARVARAVDMGLVRHDDVVTSGTSATEVPASTVIGP